MSQCLLPHLVVCQPTKSLVLDQFPSLSLRVHKIAPSHFIMLSLSPPLRTRSPSKAKSTDTQISNTRSSPSTRSKERAAQPTHLQPHSEKRVVLPIPVGARWHSTMSSTDHNVRINSLILRDAETGEELCQRECPRHLDKEDEESCGES